MKSELISMQMPSALGEMLEERLDRPEDQHDQDRGDVPGSERTHENSHGSLDGQPSWNDDAWQADPSSHEISGSNDGMDRTSENMADPESDQNDVHKPLLSNAMREASRRKDGRPVRSNAPGGLHPFIDKPRTRSTIAAGLPDELAGGPSDETLFIQYQQGNDEAFFSIYERYKTSIYAYCAQVLFSAGLPRESVEDTFQDVFFRLVQYRHTFNGGEFRPWIFTITRHSCLTAKKRSYRDHDGQEYSGDGVNLEGASDEVRMAFSSNDDPLERMSMEEQTGLLLAALAKLPDEFREALILSEYEGLTYDEIGHLMGASLSTVRIRIFRAKAKLRKMLWPVLGDPNGLNPPRTPVDQPANPSSKKRI